jgi:hypothetical protein
MKKTLCSVLLLFLSAGLALGSPKVNLVTDSEEAKLRYASAQHEIISILLQKGDFDSVLPELDKILALGLKGDNEKLVVQEIWVISDQLVAAGQYPLAHQIVDKGLQITKGRDNRFTLQMLKGKIYKEQGLLKEAIEVYRLAQDSQE